MPYTRTTTEARAMKYLHAEDSVIIADLLSKKRDEMNKYDLQTVIYIYVTKVLKININDANYLETCDYIRRTTNLRSNLREVMVQFYHDELLQKTRTELSEMIIYGRKI